MGQTPSELPRSGHGEYIALLTTNWYEPLAQLQYPTSRRADWPTAESASAFVVQARLKGSERANVHPLLAARKEQAPT